jgi:hypothetical protein
MGKKFAALIKKRTAAVLWFRFTISIFLLSIIIIFVITTGVFATPDHSGNSFQAATNESNSKGGIYITLATSSEITINAYSGNNGIAEVRYSDNDYYTTTSSYDKITTDSISTNFHHIRLTGLKADTLYHYQLISGDMITPDYSFRTFPDYGAFSFAVISDTQDELPNFSQYDRFKLIADRIAEDPEIAFVLHCGDLVNNGDSIEDWERFFDSGRQLLTGIPIFPAQGNHDGDGSLYNRLFGLPPYYSFDCAGVHFTILDTNDNVNPADETTWLSRDLQSNQDWKFAAFHYPLYTSEPNHFGGWENFQNSWENILIQNKVNGVWNGHIHAYERYYEKDIDYMVIGSGGGPSTQLSTPKFEGYRNGLENGLAYAKITVDPKSEYAEVQIMRVADISADNKQIVKIYPPDTEFESFVISRTALNRPDWDLNDDYICNDEDIAIIESHWKQSDVPGWIPADLNKDGIVDMRDAILLGLHWNEKG